MPIKTNYHPHYHHDANKLAHLVGPLPLRSGYLYPRQVAELPSPLGIPQLRRHQVGERHVSAPEFIAQIEHQFHLSNEDATRVIETVVRNALLPMETHTKRTIAEALNPGVRDLLLQQS